MQDLNGHSKSKCCSSARRAFSLRAGRPRRRDAAAGVPTTGGIPGENGRATGCEMQGLPLAGAARPWPARSRGILHAPPGHRGSACLQSSAQTLFARPTSDRPIAARQGSDTGWLRGSPAQSMLSCAQPLDRLCPSDDRGQRAACASRTLSPCAGVQAGMGLRRTKQNRRAPACWTAL